MVRWSRERAKKPPIVQRHSGDNRAFVRLYRGGSAMNRRGGDQRARSARWIADSASRRGHQADQAAPGGASTMTRTS